MLFWGIVVILGLALAGVSAVAWQTQARDRSRREMFDQCLPCDREQAEFFAKCGGTGRVRH